MQTLVVTGGIGSGKTLVCSFFAEHGIPVYDSDSRTKALYENDRALPGRISEAVGTDIVDPEGRIDRKRLASLIFSDEARLEAVERVVHPAVLEDFLRWKAEMEGIQTLKQEKAPFVLFESAIILTKPLFRSIADKILLVDAPVETRLARACARDGVEREAVLDRMSRQKLLNDISDGLVQPDVDYVIVNDGSAEEVQQKVSAIYHSLIWK